MAYRIIIDPSAGSAIKALPSDTRSTLDQVMTVLSEVPWNGESINRCNPDGEVRAFPLPDDVLATFER